MLSTGRNAAMGLHVCGNAGVQNYKEHGAQGVGGGIGSEKYV